MHNIPNFPTFKNLTLEDKDAYDLFYKKLGPYSDFSFNNLWIWYNTQNEIGISNCDNCIILRINNPFDRQEEYCLIGCGECSNAISQLFKWQKLHDIEPKIVMVPEVVIKNLFPTESRYIHYKEDVNNNDYIYDIEAMYSATGSSYVKYRNALSKFRRSYSEDLSVLNIDVKNLSNKVLLINSLHCWESTYRQNQQAQLEGAALDAYLRYADQLSVNCVGIFITGKLCAFSLYQLLPENGYAIVNNLKCNYAYNYIFDFTFSQIIRILHEKKITYVNLEQDLGIQGLRIHKQRLQPVKYLKRYTLTPT
jgi:hypothetical protein